jgi:hypothetical protein
VSLMVSEKPINNLQRELLSERNIRLEARGQASSTCA